jgi:hypothetical protein
MNLENIVMTFMHWGNVYEITYKPGYFPNGDTASFRITKNGHWVGSGTVKLPTLSVTKDLIIAHENCPG